MAHNNGNPVYSINADIIEITGHTVVGDEIDIQTDSGQDIRFNQDVITTGSIRGDLYATKSGDVWAIPNANSIGFQKPCNFGNNAISGIAGISLNASQIQSSNYNGQTLDHELDALTTAQNTLLGRTQGLTANRLAISNNAGILATGSLIESNLNTLSGNQTITGNKTYNGDIIIDDLTASRLVLSDGSKKLVSGIAENTINTLAGNQTVSGNKTHSGDITINDLTASKLVLSDGSKKLVSGVAEADLFKLNVAGNQYQGVTGATVYSQTQASNASDSVNFIRMTQGTSSPKEMGLKMVGATQSLNFTDTLNLLDLGDGDDGTVIGQIKNNGINIISGKTYQINGSQISSANLSNDSNLAKLDATENNFTGIVDGASFKQGNSALNFSHLAGTVSTSQVADGAITNAKISAVATSKLTGTVATAQVADGAITNAKISAVATSKLTGTVATAQVADGAITNAKISAVATSKLTGNIGDSLLSSNVPLLDINNTYTGITTFSNKTRSSNNSSGESALSLSAGQGSTGGNNVSQISFGYNGTYSSYRQYISSRHNSSGANGNAIDFHLCNGNINCTLTSNSVLAFSIGGDVIKAKVPLSATANITVSSSADFITSSGSQTTINSGGILELLDGAITKLGTNSITKINNALPSVNSSIAYDTAGKPSFVKFFHGEQYLRSVFPASLLATNQPLRMRFDVIPIENDSSVISSNYRQSVTTDTHNSLQPFADDGSARDERHQIAPTYNITRNGTFASSSLISECNLVFNDGHISGSNDHKSVFIKGCGYINWAHSGWGSHIQGATNKFVRLGVKCSETVRVMADGQQVGTVNRTGGDNHQGIGSSAPSTFQYHMFPAKGDYTTIEVVAFNFNNSLVIDFEVYPISYWNDP